MDNLERIRQFISNNEGTTEYKVAKYMSDNHYCARDTTHNLIYNRLIPDGKIIDKKIGNSFHKLYINDEDEFNVLVNRIDKMYRMAEELNTQVDTIKLKRLTRSKDKKDSKFNLHFSNLLHFVQLVRYNMMAQVAHEIQHNIKSNDGRETLYLQLVRILALTSKSNESIIPFALKGFTDTLKEIQSRKKDKELAKDLENLVDYWLYGPQVSQNVNQASS